MTERSVMRRIWCGLAGLAAAGLLSGCIGVPADDDALCPGGANCPSLQAR